MDLKFVKAESNQLPPGMQGTPQKEPELSVNAIPDLEKLLSIVLEMLLYINTDEMQKLETTDEIAFEHHLDAKFEYLSSKYYIIFKMLLDKKHRTENIEKLIDTFSILRDVKSGSINIHDADKNYKEALNEQYIYPKYGGKENFEKEMLNNKKIKKKHKSN